MRICHLISGDLWAGAEVMASHLLKSLHKFQGINIIVIVLNEGRLANELKLAGLDVLVVDENRISFFSIVKTIRKIIGQYSPNIIHSHRYKENILAYLVSRFYPGINLVTTQHGLPENHDSSDSFKHSLKSRFNFFVLSRFFKKVVAVSQNIERFFVTDLGFSAPQIAVIPNGIEIPETRSRERHGHSFVIGSSGRLFPVKDYQLMVNIAKELSGVDEIRFVLAGDGPDRRSIEQSIAEGGLSERFCLLGHLETMEPFYQGLDLYLNTSLHEGIPMTILEAMASGLPVVAPRVGGIPDIITDGTDGCLLSGRDPRLFADTCLGFYQDPARCEQMGQAAKKRVVDAFSNDVMARQYMQLYTDIVSDEAGREIPRGS